MAGEAPQLSAHDAAMVAKVDAAQASATTSTAVGQAPVVPNDQPAVAQRPSNVPEQFWDAAKGTVNQEALLAAYVELQTKTPAAPNEGAQGEPPADNKTAEDAVKAAKLDMSTLQQEFASSGALSEASYKALEGVGIDRSMVDAYVAGQQALAASHEASGYELAGGKEAYQSMAKWAMANLSPAEQAAFDRAVGGDAATMKQAIVALKAQYTAAMGSDPSLLGGAGGGGQSGEVAFQSRAEVTTAMRDPRYRADPAYRATVERRIGLMDSF